MDALQIKYSGRALVREVEAVDPGIALALYAPVATNIEAEGSLALDDTVATELESEVNFSLIFVSIWTDASSVIVVVVVNVCARSDFFAIDKNSYAPTPPPPST